MVTTVQYRLYDVPNRCASTLADALLGMFEGGAPAHTGSKLEHISCHGQPYILVTIHGVDQKEWYAVQDGKFRRRVSNVLAGIRCHILACTP